MISTSSLSSWTITALARRQASTTTETTCNHKTEHRAASIQLSQSTPNFPTSPLIRRMLRSKLDGHPGPWMRHRVSRLLPETDFGTRLKRQNGDESG